MCEKPNAIDVRSLYKEHDVFTYDPGFMSTASCMSAITYIDGAKGILRYRGYSIEELVNKSNYLETCYLLINELQTVRNINLMMISIITQWCMNNFRFYIVVFLEISPNGNISWGGCIFICILS